MSCTWLRTHRGGGSRARFSSCQPTRKEKGWRFFFFPPLLLHSYQRTSPVAKELRVPCITNDSRQPGRCGFSRREETFPFTGSMRRLRKTGGGGGAETTAPRPCQPPFPRGTLQHEGTPPPNVGPWFPPHTLDLRAPRQPPPPPPTPASPHRSAPRRVPAGAQTSPAAAIGRRAAARSAASSCPRPGKGRQEEEEAGGGGEGRG